MSREAAAYWIAWSRSGDDSLDEDAASHSRDIISPSFALRFARQTGGRSECRVRAISQGGKLIFGRRYRISEEPMIELLEVRAGDLEGDLASGVHRLLSRAFPEDGPNDGDYYRAVGRPDMAMILRDGSVVFGHLGLYTRRVRIGVENVEIGMLGGIAIAPDRRLTGHSRALIQRAHQRLAERQIPFSILFAHEPRIYQGCGYRLMQNATHFIEPDGTPNTLVYRGSMYAELSSTRWPNQLLDLCGRTV